MRLHRKFNGENVDAEITHGFKLQPCNGDLMSQSIFKYPGSKTLLSNWIIDHLPAHHTYVEPFGGAAAVLANKPASDVEIYNDLDGDLVHFMLTMRDSAAELKEWVRQTPHSRQLYDEFATAFYDGYRPDDDIERAGRFFYLRYSQWGTKYNEKSGYNGSKKRNIAARMNIAAEQLDHWQQRFQNVQIEQLDFEELIHKYEGSETVLYCDPPYLDEGDDLYSHDEFEHGRFIDCLAETDSDWIVSYTRLPEPLRELASCIKSQERRVRMRQGRGDWEKTNTEHLIMNFDPKEELMFRESEQTALENFK